MRSAVGGRPQVHERLIRLEGFLVRRIILALILVFSAFLAARSQM
jgi:hypothetical protein